MTEPRLRSGELVLEVVALSHAYGQKNVLNNISLKVYEGETIAIIGPSGSGKSTLARCINLLEDVQEGAIIFKGRNLQTPPFDQRSVRRKIGMVFQNFELFPHLSVLDNIALAPIHAAGIAPDDAYRSAHQLLRRVHIGDKADAFPDELSGGQQQRVAIARALAMQPELMLFDEPTSALDPEMVREVLDVISELAESGLTSILVTHEMAFARRVADRIVFMSDGEIVEEAPPHEFFAKPQSERARRFVGQMLDV